MKTALIHEWLTKIGGSEKVLEAIYEIYPSPIYVLVKDEELIKETIFENAKVYTSFIQKLPMAKKNYAYYLPLFPFAIEQFDLSEYDLIISSSHSVAKGVITNADQIHICYCYTPMRYAWDLYHLYIKSIKGISSVIAKLALHYLRIWDLTSLAGVDYFITISKYTAKRIKKIYRKEAQVIYPPVDVERFEMSSKKEDFYLTVSRIVPYKRIDLIVEAFRHLPKKRLIVIGDGPDLKKIKGNAPANVEFLGYRPFEIVKEYMKKARAFIFAAIEDFGISPVEAQACGTPVIAYGRGGVLETVVKDETGIFFYEQSPKALIDAIMEFERKENLFEPEKIRKSVQKFNKNRFKKEFKEAIDKIKNRE